MINKKETKEEIQKRILIQKTNMLKEELKKYKKILIKYAFIETCTASVFFEDLFQKELFNGADSIRKAKLSKKKETEMLNELFWGLRGKTLEQANYEHIKRLVGWAKCELNSLPEDIKKKIIDDSIGYKDAWSNQFNQTHKIYAQLQNEKPRRKTTSKRNKKS